MDDKFLGHLKNPMALPPMPKSQYQNQTHCSSICSTYNAMQIPVAVEIMRCSSKDIFTTHPASTTCVLKGQPKPTKHGKMQQRGNPYSMFAERLGTLCREGRLKEALGIMYIMDQRGISINYDTYAILLQACANRKALAEGNQVHAHIVMRNLEQNVYLGTQIVTMYATCGSLVNARHVFDKIAKRNVRLWDAMIRGYVSNGLYEETLKLYRQMQCTGIQPDKFIFPCVLRACAGLEDLQGGEGVHDCVIKLGLAADVFVGNALLDMYTKCGNTEDALKVFDKMSQRDVISWSAMIAGFAQNGFANEALEFFHRMQWNGMKPNSVTISSVLSACSNLTALQEGRGLHGYAIRNGFEADVFVGNSLIDMFAKCGNVEDAHQVFVKMSRRDVVSWNSIIVGYYQNGDANEALQLFRRMQQDGMKPNSVTVASVLGACAHVATLRQGMEIHDYIIRNGFDLDVVVSNAIVDMYAKCGSIQTARNVFDKMPQKDVVSWTAMISGTGMNGYGANAITLFHQMQQSGLKPNSVTFVAVLSACSHSGLVAEGWEFFGCMRRDYNITPRMEHYACMVDLIGRAGSLDEAQDFIQSMPLQPDAHVWGALLGACRIHCNIELGEHVAEHLLDLEPRNAGNYILLSNIYAVAGRWDAAAKMRRMMKERGVRKRPGCSWIEVKSKTYVFVVGDKSHPQSEEIYAMLETLAEKIKEAGYVPATNFVLHDVDEEQKEYMLCGHSEKLAIAFGLINTQIDTLIRITKNLRMCGDCHRAIKFITKIAQREIVVRDTNRFHHFKDGECSCGDYW